MAVLPEIGILASGSGTTAEALIRATAADVPEAQRLYARVGLVVCNNSDAGVFERMRNLGEELGIDIPVVHISGKTNPGGRGAPGEQTAEESAEILRVFRRAHIQAYVALGYMKKVTGALLEMPGGNTHPGPLPETAGEHGIGVIRRARALGLTAYAISFNRVNPDYDLGEIEASWPVEGLDPDMSDEEWFAAAQVVEKGTIAKSVNRFLHNSGLVEIPVGAQWWLPAES